MQRPKTKPKPGDSSPGDTGGPGGPGGPLAPCRSWQAPPDGLFDVIVQQLTAKQFVVVQLVCKDWSRAARHCLKNAEPKRPDVDLGKLVTLYPNLTQLNLSHLEGWTSRMLTPLRQLTALRELCVSNIALQRGSSPPRDAAAQKAPSAADLQSLDAVEALAVGRGGQAAGAQAGAESSPQKKARTRVRTAAPGLLLSGTGGGGRCAGAAGEGQNSEAGALAAVGGTSPSPPLSPASRIFGGLGDVMLRLTKLQADLNPTLTAESIASLPSLTDLTLDTLISPAALAPLARLRSLAIKKLANPENLDRLSGLTALLINSDSSCASEFLPACTRLPELQSLTFRTSSTKVLPNADAVRWQAFSRLTSLDLRVPVEVVKPGLPALAELRSLEAMSLDLYCASEEELMVTVVAPPNLTSLSVSSDRSRSVGVIDVHPNARLRSLRLRLYWTALNLVLPEGLPEPSPLPEPLSADLMDTEEGEEPPGPSPGLVRRLEAELAEDGADGADGLAAAAGTVVEADAAAVMPSSGFKGQAPAGLGRAGGGADTGAAAEAVRQEGAIPSGRGRRRRLSGAGLSPVVPGALAAAAAAEEQMVSPGRRLWRRLGRGRADGVVNSGEAQLASGSAGGGGGGAESEEVELVGRGHGGGGAAAAPGGNLGATAPLPDLALEELCLDACFFLLYGSLVPQLNQFPRLRSLRLDNSLALENSELAQLCELTQLRRLDISGVHLLTDGGLRSLGRLSGLTAVRLRGLRKLAVHAAQAYIWQKPIVRRYEDISGSFLSSLSSLSGLRELALVHLHTAGEGQLMAGLSALTQLTRLKAVTHRGRTVVIRSLGQRLALDFEGCSLPDITRPSALPTATTQAQLIDDDTASSNQPRRSCQHSNQH
ncbi:hypothetical protein GPECTOR_7g1168 [Gonium pectorale]|uniref:F-box domain-containing protein n=1 Tax=Gonium pectorale TaxID=33097 RepID=A0A150GU14_GONPE|nr:hypothetical protein GPECTOR_7g1168 [Gonium pectorale]|eukprot:KXZ53274.1 hypothetical protein GPECTOR_7g1168 [Gonium pectorale]